jgi:solute carrier organic anion transporter family, member 3A
MTGLYSETNDDSSADLPHDAESESIPDDVPANYNPGKTAQSVTVSTTLTNPAITTTSITTVPDTVIKCHSRQPSAGIVDRDKSLHDDLVDDELLKDCGILSCRPAKMQKLARIKVSRGLPMTASRFMLPFLRRFSFSFYPCS